MARLRLNDVSSFGTANPVTLASGSGSTTATFTSAPPFPTIASPDYAVVTVEPGTTSEEIVQVTAYTSGATTATVVRNFEATTGGANAAIAHTAAAWRHGPTSADFGVVEVAAGNLGATYSLTLTGQETWVTGTLTANCAITLSGYLAGFKVLFLLTQDATGGRTVTVNGQAVAIPTAANAFSDVKVWSPDGTNLYVEAAPTAGPTGPQGPTGPTGPQGPAGSGGGLLAVTEYLPATSTQYVATSSVTDLDATHAVVTFVAPSSGKVVIWLSAFFQGWTTTTYSWRLRDTSNTVWGHDVSPLYNDQIGLQTALPIYITGLTSGNTYTMKWAHYLSFGSGSGSFPAITASPAPGPGLMMIVVGA